MAEPEWETQRWIYAGRRWSASQNKAYHAFILEGGGLTSDDEMYYGGAPKWASIGSVYAVETQDRQARVKSAERVGWFDDERVVEEWRVLDRTTAVKQEGVRAAKRLQTQNSEIGDLTLAQLWKIIQSQPQHVQDGTLLVVMRYLMRGR